MSLPNRLSSSRFEGLSRYPRACLTGRQAVPVALFNTCFARRPSINSGQAHRAISHLPTAEAMVLCARGSPLSPTNGGCQGENQDLPLTLASVGFTPRKRIDFKSYNEVWWLFIRVMNPSRLKRKS